jgi:hypothetical protein
MERACSDWRMKDAADKTWILACSHFTAHAKDQAQSQTFGNSCFQANQLVMKALAANAEELSHLQSKIANLGTSNNAQAATISQLTTQLAAAKAAQQACRDTLNQRTRTQPGNDRDQDQPGNDQRPRTEPLPRQCCWSHGWCAHCSPRCNCPKEGHQNAAALDNRLGGSDARCPL